MVSELDIKDADLLRQGYPPEDETVLDRLTIGRQVWEDFAIREYLDSYIAQGGSQIKFLVGKPGSGKTHLLRRLKRASLERGYVVAHLDASEVKLQRIDHVYRAVAGHIDLEELSRRLAHRVLQNMAYDPEEIPAGTTFLEWAVQQGRLAERVTRDVNDQLDYFFKQRNMLTSLCLAYIQLAADKLGVRHQPGEAKDILYRWIQGEPLKVSQLRPLLISRPVDRYNARDMLDSLSRLMRELGFQGLVILVDRMEDILARDPETGKFKYTRAALQDVYQSLREFIDAVPRLTSVFMVMAGRKELLDDSHRGIKSYDALWLRVQHEVMAKDRFNRFAQIVDMDKGAELVLTEEDFRSLHRRIRELLQAPTGEGDIPREVLSSYGEEGQYRRAISHAANYQTP